jgi:hypothetical protein
MEDDGPYSSVSQFEMTMLTSTLSSQSKNATVWIEENGHFIDQSWVNQGTDDNAIVKATKERPAVLHPCLRHPHTSVVPEEADRRKVVCA